MTVKDRGYTHRALCTGTQRARSGYATVAEDRFGLCSGLPASAWRDGPAAAVTSPIRPAPRGQRDSPVQAMLAAARRPQISATVHSPTWTVTTPNWFFHASSTQPDTGERHDQGHRRS